jgi:hypothetical protein
MQEEKASVFDDNLRKGLQLRRICGWAQMPRIPATVLNFLLKIAPFHKDKVQFLAHRLRKPPHYL